MDDFIPFIDKRLFIKKNPIIRYGVFTNSEIEENKFIEIAPVIICDEPDMNIFGGGISNYFILWNNQLAISLGWASIYNHSDNNNCDISSNYHDNLIGIVTKRKIAAGEQITVNYGNSWFATRNIEKIDL